MRTQFGTLHTGFALEVLFNGIWYISADHNDWLIHVLVWCKLWGHYSKRKNTYKMGDVSFPIQYSKILWEMVHPDKSRETFPTRLPPYKHHYTIENLPRATCINQLGLLHWITVIVVLALCSRSSITTYNNKNHWVRYYVQTEPTKNSPRFLSRDFLNLDLHGELFLLSYCHPPKVFHQ